MVCIRCDSNMLTSISDIHYRKKRRVFSSVSCDDGDLDCELQFDHVHLVDTPTQLLAMP